ncbi:hypothetical protein N7475_009880 [Penicillium sp. IBT 31633x]|nr:hypothetical protein N7475_009880 [Penicillium sp. IBT 31633x]
MFIIIDEESLKTLQGISAEDVAQQELEDMNEELRCVKVLEAWPIVRYGEKKEIMIYPQGAM